MHAYNFHSIAMSAGVLLVECKQCGRRAALTKREGLPIWQGNMTPVKDARVKCRCGCTEVRRYIPSSEDQVVFFLAGDPAGAMRQAS
jgi:hypothetical protein